MKEIQIPITPKDIEPEGIWSRKIETPSRLYYKGMDGKEYLDPLTMREANKEWISRQYRYISHDDYMDMKRDEQVYFRE